MNTERVIVAMSGGVDSSVTAWLLQNAGYEVVGVHMHLWCEERMGPGAKRRHCCSDDDRRDAEDVCSILDIPFYVLNLENEFQTYVVDYFCREYHRGRTPNPCLACNQHVKFGFLLYKVKALGGRYLATGHHARIKHNAGRYQLLKGVDPDKDQSYFLYMLGQDEMSSLLFPIGEYTKDEVRQVAGREKLPVAEKVDSTDICFVTEDYRTFIEDRFPPSAGDIVDSNCRVLGQHAGLAGYTIGQRQGLGLSGGRRLYVVDMDVAANRLVVGPEEELYSSHLVASSVNWIQDVRVDGELDLTARIRYRSSEEKVRVFPEDDSVEVFFEKPQRAIAPGQAVVFYSGEEVLGGGIIERSTKDAQECITDSGGRTTASGAGL